MRMMDIRDYVDEKVLGSLHETDAEMYRMTVEGFEKYISPLDPSGDLTDIFKTYAVGFYDGRSAEIERRRKWLDSLMRAGMH